MFFSHDSSHKHDWESATVVWKRTKPDDDWWYRYELIISNHKTHHKRKWTEIESSKNIEDIENGASTWSSLHPHVYSGMYTHANFFTADTRRKALAFDLGEYRSDNWYFMPGNVDMKNAYDIKPEWDYGSTSSKPSTIDTCA